MYKISEVITFTSLPCLGSYNKQSLHAYILYSCRLSNFRLIFEPNLQFNCKFTVKEAENQPKIDSNAFKFVEMCNDCHLTIASYLNLIDIVHLGKTSSRLRTFAEQIYRKRTHFSFGTNTGDSSINETNLPTILQEMGSYIRSIDWTGLSETHLEYLFKYCRNVEVMNMNRPKKSLELTSIEKNKSFFQKIESLRIENAGFSDAVMETIISSTSNLKSLEFELCYRLGGTFLLGWKDSKLERLKYSLCASMSTAIVLDFQRANKLVKFSSDSHDSFVSCLSLPSSCLSEYTDLELALNSSSHERLDFLHINELKQLKTMRLACKSLDTSFLSNYKKILYNYDKVFVALSQIDTLKSIHVEKIIFGANTIKCLGLIKNLEEVTIQNSTDQLQRQLYWDIPMYLTKITKLTIIMYSTTEYMDVQSICDMITALDHLRYFSHSLMTWQLLDMILQDQLLRRRPSIEIGISRSLFFDVERMVCTITRCNF